MMGPRTSISSWSIYTGLNRQGRMSSSADFADDRALIRHELWRDMDNRAWCLRQGDFRAAKVYSRVICAHYERLRQLCCAELELKQAESDCCSVFSLCNTITIKPKVFVCNFAHNAIRNQMHF